MVIYHRDAVCNSLKDFMKGKVLILGVLYSRETRLYTYTYV